RTGVTFTVWREAEITQAAVAWLLACVFVRFLEDNDLLSEVYLAGPNGRTKSAQERQRLWYREHPLLIDRDYLLDIFSELVRLPGMKGLLDRDHNPLWSLGPDGDGAKAILDFFQSADHDTGVLLYDFTDTVRGTRFLGDLYQNISESARKRYALLQTPDFIVDFILDRTLTPALDEFGLEGFRLIDPACGSGHFLLEAFDRLFGPTGLSPSWCTSLSEDSVHIDHLLRRQTYSVVVGNPPYITVQDAELRKKYRGLYRSCARAYQVSVPFTELFVDLADKSRPGYVGMIVSNGFMKRSFGKPLIERLLPKWDMTHVMDTAGVYLPGHGTATAILIGRNRHPIRQTVRVVRGMRGEREAPNDPANAPVWREICEQLDNPGYHGRYVSIADAERETFHRHPWSIG